MTRFSLIPLLFTSALLCAEPLSDEQMVQKASDVSAQLLQKLGGELKTHMQNGGPMAALSFCSLNALSLTDQVAHGSNSAVKRVSILNRNPINAATADEAALLNEWEALIKNGKPLPSHALKKDSNGESIYYKPILINNEACLKCHGDIPADAPLAKAIRSIYPEDRAMGYKMGDLRGMIVVGFPR